jgi:hypothetical protein
MQYSSFFFANLNKTQLALVLLIISDKPYCASAKVVQVFPPVTEHYNLHPNCLHLWSCLEADGLPDFQTMGAV